jgi:cytochrome c peroxidase
LDSVTFSSISAAVVLGAALALACDGSRGAAVANDAGRGRAGARSMPSDAAMGDADARTTHVVPESGAPPEDPDPEPTLTAAEREKLLSLSPVAWPSLPSDPTNRFADDVGAAELGEKFFFDPSFSGKLLSTDHDGTPGSLGRPGDTGRVACASCHVRESGFSDTRSFQRQISLGAGWGRRRAPSLLDVGHSRVIMWDGRRDSLFGQIFGPVESVVEMNSSRLYLAEQIAERYAAEYEAVFGPLPPLADPARFPKLTASVTGCGPKHPTEPLPACDGPFHGSPGDRAEFDSMTAADQVATTTVAVNFGKAIGAFERRLSCGPGAFDAWIHGDPSALSRAAQRGAALFAGKAGCVTCHSGTFLSDEAFHNVGLAPQIVQQAFIDSDDHGAASGIAALRSDPLNSAGRYSDGADDRIPRAVIPAMEGGFRTPKLRCVSSRPAFMHTGHLGTLEKVVEFFDRGGDPSFYPGTSEIHTLGLSRLERGDLVAFLKSLDAKSSDGG